MITENVLKIGCLLMALAQVSCSEVDPAVRDFQGSWRSVDGGDSDTSIRTARLNLKRDFTYYASNFPYRLVHYGGDPQAYVDETSGTWSIIEEGSVGIRLAPIFPLSSKAAVALSEKYKNGYLLKFNVDGQWLFLEKK